MKHRRIPVILMLQEKQETLVPINAVSPCRSVHIPHYCCFRTQRPKPLVKGQKCSAHQQRHSSAHDVCVDRQQLAKVWRRDFGPLQCKGRSGPDHGCTAQTVFVNPGGQTCFTLASIRQCFCDSNQHHGQSSHSHEQEVQGCC